VASKMSCLTPFWRVGAGDRIDGRARRFSSPPTPVISNGTGRSSAVFRCRYVGIPRIRRATSRSRPADHRLRLPRLGGELHVLRDARRPAPVRLAALLAAFLRSSIPRPGIRRLLDSAEEVGPLDVPVSAGHSAAREYLVPVDGACLNEDVANVL